MVCVDIYIYKPITKKLVSARLAGGLKQISLCKLTGIMVGTGSGTGKVRESNEKTIIIKHIDIRKLFKFCAFVAVSSERKKMEAYVRTE